MNWRLKYSFGFIITFFTYLRSWKKYLNVFKLFYVSKFKLFVYWSSWTMNYKEQLIKWALEMVCYILLDNSYFSKKINAFLRKWCFSMICNGTKISGDKPNYCMYLHFYETAKTGPETRFISVPSYSTLIIYGTSTSW